MNSQTRDHQDSNSSINSQVENNSNIISGHSHSFDTGIASTLGLHCAIVFQHIIYWLRINASKKNAEFIEEKIWMYEKQEDIAAGIGYLSVDEVKKAIGKLLKSGLLIKGQYNKNPFDHTSWYTASDQSIIFKGHRNSKNSYEGAKRHDPACDVAPSESAKWHDPHYIPIEQQEKQQQDAAVFFDCLKDVKIPEADKIWLTKNYPEVKIQKVLAWAAHPSTKINQTLQQALKWACAQPDTSVETPKPIVDVFSENKKHAQELEKIYAGSKEAQLIACNNYAEVSYKQGSNTTAIDYKEKGFKEQLDSALRKYGLK